MKMEVHNGMIGISAYFYRCHEHLWFCDQAAWTFATLRVPDGEALLSVARDLSWFVTCKCHQKLFLMVMVMIITMIIVIIIIIIIMIIIITLQ